MSPADAPSDLVGSTAAKLAGVILIVDDTPDNLAMLSRALEQAGYLVLVALSGNAALQSMRKMRPDLVMLDAVMPTLDGFETCRMIKADPALSDVPIVFMTALTESDHVVRGFAAGGIDYVTKPIRTSEVIARVSSHLRQTRTLQQLRFALESSERAITVAAPDGLLLWSTPSAQEWIRALGSASTDGGRDRGDHGVGSRLTVPAQLRAWLDQLADDDTAPSMTQVYRAQVAGHTLQAKALGRSMQGEWVLLLETRNVMEPGLLQQYRLTSRETEVLLWVTKGKTNRDIGEILGMSPRTVNKHLEHIYAKLGVETRTAAAAIVMKSTHR
jgi:DNA-binding response OmpR family regulator/DNA-binding CsgD family transcriptional regulator